MRSNAYDCPIEWISDFIRREGIEYCDQVAGYGYGCLTLCRRDWLAEYNAHHEQKMKTWIEPATTTTTHSEPSIITFSKASSEPALTPTSIPQTPQFPQLAKRENATEFRQRMEDIFCFGKWWCLSKREDSKKPTILPQVPTRIPRGPASTPQVPHVIPENLGRLAHCPLDQISDIIKTAPIESCEKVGSIKPYCSTVCRSAWVEHNNQNHEPHIRIGTVPMKSTISTFKAEHVDP